MNNVKLKMNKVFIYTVSDFKPGSIECIEMLFSTLLKENNENVELNIITNNNRPYKEIDKRIKIIEDNNENGNKWVGFLKFSDKIPRGYSYYVYLDSDILYYGKSSDLFDINCDFTIVREGRVPMINEWFFYKKSTQEEFVKMSKLIGLNSGTFAYKDINFLERVRKLYENETASDALSNGKLEQASFNYAICKEIDFTIDNRVLDLSDKALLHATGKQFNKEKTIYHFNSFTNTMNRKVDKMKAFLDSNFYRINGFDDIEIHSLMCHRDISYGVNCLKSLIRYEEFSRMQIVIHDDGSLTTEDKEILYKISDRLSVIDRKYADSQILNFIKDKPNCINYRIKESPINTLHKIKLFDYYYFSKTKKILGLDSDLLFLKKPDDVIKHISANTGFYFPDYQNAYSFNEPKDEIKTLEKVNTGLICILGESNYSLDLIENALSNLIRNGVNHRCQWIEQSAFAHMFCELGGFECLDPKIYRLPYFQPVDRSTAECLHFVNYPPVREKYKEFVTLIDI